MKEDNKKTAVKKRATKKREKTREVDMIKKSVEFNLLEVIIIILITGIVVSIASGLIVYNNYDKLNIKEATNSELSEFVESYNHIINSYVEEVDKKELID